MNQFMSRLQISNIKYNSYQLFLLSYICNKTRVKCHLLIRTLAYYTLGAEQGQAYLMAEHLLIVLTYLCNEQATHTSSPHFEVMHININAFKEIT